MTRISALVVFVLLAMVTPAVAQVQNYKPVTQDMLLNPTPNDWLMYSRTYDAWRYSPLKQINTKNVSQLRMAWVRGLGPGTTETIPIVHDGVMYVIAPGGIVDALDATSGDLIWEHKREYKNPQIGSVERTKALAIYEDMVYFTAPDGFVVALDVRTGKVRWETYKTDTQNTSGALVIDGKVISGGTCGKGRDSCFIEADNAETGEKVWRFYTVAQSDDPGYASWGGAGRSLPPMLARWRERTGRVRGFGVLPVHAGLVPGGCRFGAEGLPVAFAAGVAPVGVPLSVFV